MLERRRLWISGCVQGVGFRPFVWRQATQLHLTGEVCNTGRGVLVDVQGERGSLQALEVALRRDLPPLARIDGIRVSAALPRPDWRGFSIAASRETDEGMAAAIPVDTAVCDACVAELFTPSNRRWRHAFIGCTDCGPRFTLTLRTPYDRAHTSMAAFEMCPACAREYHDPASRRFHAEPIACPHCGPRLRFEDWGAATDAAPDDPIRAAWRLIQSGGIVAVQGLGGFHLMCDARQAATVARLRQRKHRPAKPFAVLAPNTASAARWAHLDDTDADLLNSAQRPIVLLPLREQRPDVLAGIAPGLRQLGLMLPGTPIHYLLFHAALGEPQGMDWLHQAHDLIWVATSANRSGQPLLTDPDQARGELTGIADAMLYHDRPIAARCDDSVVLSRGNAAALPLRRARGYVPQPLDLPRSGPAVLALGGYLNNCFTVTDGAQAWVSQHIGDLSSAAACRALEATVERWLDYWRIAPQAVVCDLQPDIYSSRLAARLARTRGLPLLTVQHHHAHIAAVLAEHGHDEPALGLALDGFGLGDDGAAWGGELLRLAQGRAERLGHITPLPLPGGDAAARAPWRMALALLHRLGDRQRLPVGVDAPTAARVHTQIERGLNCPQTTSLGRWFDAVAGLAGICPQQSYEGEAAMKLEALAGPVQPVATDAALWRIDGLCLDLLPLAARLADLGDNPGDAETIASLWHSALARALADWIRQAMAATGLRTVALAGGCCANRLLVQGLAQALAGTPCRLLQARQLPPGDGGLSLGQAWVALQQWRNGNSDVPSFSCQRGS